jgi:hypothetical protein
VTMPGPLSLVQGIGQLLRLDSLAPVEVAEPGDLHRNGALDIGIGHPPDDHGHRT